MADGKVVFRETRKVSAYPELLELCLEGTVIELAGSPYLRAHNEYVIVSRFGTLLDSRPGAPLDEEGNPKLFTEAVVTLVPLKSRFDAPRLCVEAANQWFERGEACMRALAAEESVQAESQK